MVGDLKAELELRLRSRNALMYIVSQEEERVIRRLKELCTERRLTLISWDPAEHFQSLIAPTSGMTLPHVKDPVGALESVDKMQGELLFVFRDFHLCWDNKAVGCLFLGHGHGHGHGELIQG